MQPCSMRCESQKIGLWVVNHFKSPAKSYYRKIPKNTIKIHKNAMAQAMRMASRSLWSSAHDLRRGFFVHTEKENRVKIPDAIRHSMRTACAVAFLGDFPLANTV